MAKLKYIALALLVVLLVAGYFVAHKDQGTDEAQIAAVIDRARTGIEEKNLSETMSCISPTYSDQNGYNYDRLRLLGVELFRSEAKYKVNVAQPEVKVTGDTATAKARVTVTSSGGGMDNVIPLREVTLDFRKESVRKFLIYKVPAWKVSSMENGIPTMDSPL